MMRFFKYLWICLTCVALSGFESDIKAQDSSVVDLTKLEQITAENAASVEELYVFTQENGQYAGDIAFSSYSPNDKLFTFSINGSLNVWDITTGDYVWRVPCCGQNIVFSFDNQYLVTSEEMQLYLWKLSSPNEWITLATGILPDHTDAVTPVDIRYLESANEIIATYNSGLGTTGIIRWNNAGELLGKLDYGYGTDMRTEQNTLFNETVNLNVLLLPGYPGNTIGIRDISPNRVRATVDFSKIAADKGISNYYVDLLDVSIDDETLVNLRATDATTSLLAWINSEGSILNYAEHQLEQLSAAEFPGPRAVEGIMALGSYDTGEIYLWNTDTVYEYAMLSGHTKGIVDLAFNPGHTLLASSSLDGTVRLWGVPSKE